MPPQASVIFTTYNSPRSLELVLRGYLRQNRRDFEIVVADDGSTEETAAVIETAQKAAPFPILHVWQPDDGFQKCRILNKAILCAAADYLIVSDGDCIPRADFVDAHLRLRRPGHYLSGGLFRLSRAVTDIVSAQDVEAGVVFEPHWLEAHGQRRKARQYWKLMKNRRLARFLEAAIPVRPSWNGANSSCWKEDAVRVNGFDERMQYGALDREFGLRLVNAGIKPRRVRYSACCAHLDHDRSYDTDESWQRNRKIREITKKSRIIACPVGLDTHADVPAEQFLYRR